MSTTAPTIMVERNEPLHGLWDEIVHDAVKTILEHSKIDYSQVDFTPYKPNQNEEIS